MPVQYSSAVHLLNPALTRRPRWRGDRTIDTCAGRVSASRYAWIITYIHVTILIGEKFFLSRYLTLLSSGIINSGVKSDARRVARPARPDALFTHTSRARPRSLCWCSGLFCCVVFSSSLLFCHGKKAEGESGNGAPLVLTTPQLPPLCPAPHSGTRGGRDGAQRRQGSASPWPSPRLRSPGSPRRSRGAISRRGSSSAPGRRRTRYEQLLL
jgi:hypothetical protein